MIDVISDTPSGIDKTAIRFAEELQASKVHIHGESGEHTLCKTEGHWTQEVEESIQEPVTPVKAPEPQEQTTLRKKPLSSAAGTIELKRLKTNKNGKTYIHARLNKDGKKVTVVTYAKNAIKTLMGTKKGEHISLYGTWEKGMFAAMGKNTQQKVDVSA
jgi:hypothetical protein